MGVKRRQAKRLPEDVVATHVRIQLDVDPERGRAISGRVQLDLELDEPRRFLLLHAAELRVSEALLHCGAGEWPGRIRAIPEQEMIRLDFPERLPAGPATLSLRFRGRLRDDLRGLYHARSGGRAYAISQLAATHARRVFPCLDEPAKKACFQLSVTTDAEHQVISNQPRRRLERRSDGRHTHHFAATPPIASYLVALAVGRFEATRSQRVGETPIRVWTVPGKKQLGGFALQAARASLERLEAWFGLPHPYAKLDLVAVPDFELGAMENVGAVFFRETALLLEPATASSAERRRVAEIVAHELSHMWFGNLVTMAWWDDLWLNESFATWMAFHVVDDWQPEWRIWRDFLRRRAGALELDALSDTHPIYTEVRHPDEATENFDMITYEKGAAVIRMLERSLGAGVFKRGVRRYIRRHREGNARGLDLWRALGEAAGRNLTPEVRAWIERPGHPIVRVRRVRGGRSLEVRQEPVSGRDREGWEPWPIAFAACLGRPRGTRVLGATVRRSRARIALPAGPPPDFVYGNAEEAGFYRAWHDDDELRRLAAHRERLAPLERIGLMDHTWALVSAGHISLEVFLELLPELAEERDPVALCRLVDALEWLDARVLARAGAEPQAAFQERLCANFAPALGTLGQRPKRGESEDDRLRRGLLVRLLGGAAAHRPTLAAARAGARELLRDPRAVDPSLADPYVRLAARHGDQRLYEAFQRARQRAKTPQQARRYLLALTAFPDPNAVQRSLRLSLDPQVAGGEVAILLSELLANPAAQDATWKFAKRHWSRLERRMGTLLVTRFIEATPALGTAAARRDVAAFFRAHPVPTGARTVRQSLERFDRQLRFQRRAAVALRHWLSTQP